MEDRKVNILGIAPYEAMKTSMLRLAQSKTGIDLDVYVGDLHYGADLVRRHIDDKYYDAIISRGGTAELIEQITPIPVIEISLSVYDILRALKLAENCKERYAIVGFSSITANAHTLCSLLRYQIDIFTIHNGEEGQAVLEKLKKEGYHMVVCDMVSHTKAKALGLNTILITSGTESIEAAFDQAIQIGSGYTRVYHENIFLKNVLKHAGHCTIIFDEKGRMVFSSWNKEQEDQVIALLAKELSSVQESDSHKFFRNINGTLFSIIGQVIPFRDEKYTVFYFTESKIPISAGKYGILFYSKKEAEELFFSSFYSTAGALGNLSDSVEQISQSAFPVMITGETGTGKDPIAMLLYTKSSLNINPLVMIDCGRLTEKGWNYLTNHYNSPFNDNDNTIYIKNIDLLPSDKAFQLLSFFSDIHLSKRNRLFFSCVSTADSILPQTGQMFVKQLSCLTVCLPPLRDRIQELPTLASIYLATLNLSLGKQLIGLEPKAMELLQNYEWPQNYAQFKRLMNELAVLTNTPYITSDTVSVLLDKERSLTGSIKTSIAAVLNFNRPLEDINRDIIRQALANNQGNQSVTAKQLGISRTTLWRYLKKDS